MRSYDSRVSRGGGFLYDARLARASNRGDNTPTIRSPDLGVRPSRLISY
jgi:formylglycine-generating enzyme required for sulfatase activity